MESENALKKPTLLVLASTYPRWKMDEEPGFVHELCKRLVRDFNVIVLCPHSRNSPTAEHMEGVEVVRYRYAPSPCETLVNSGGIISNLRRSRWKLLLLPSFILSQAWNAWRILRNRNVDVIHAHWILPQGLLAALLTCFTLDRRVPYVVTSHGADLFALRVWPFSALKRFVLRRAVATTVVSKGMLDEIMRLGCSNMPVHVEPMGVDLSSRFRVAPNEPRGSKELLFVGRLVEKKGLRYLIEAMPLIVASIPGVKLTIAGFGPELDERQAQVRMLGMDKNVTFVGGLPQEELPHLYRRATLFIAPFVEAVGGDQEGLGLVLLEALGCGCPVVVSLLPATRDLAERCDAVHGVASADSVALATTIVELLEQPRPFQINGIEDFDWPARAESYSRLLLRCAVP